MLSTSAAVPVSNCHILINLNVKEKAMYCAHAALNGTTVWHKLVHHRATYFSDVT